MKTANTTVPRIIAAPINRAVRPNPDKEIKLIIAGFSVEMGVTDATSNGIESLVNV